MAVNVSVLRREFRNVLKNGENFALNDPDFNRNLAGCIGERIQVRTEYKVVVVVDLIAPNFNANLRQFRLFYSGNLLGIDKQDDINWNDEGFFQGQKVLTSFIGDTTLTKAGTIQRIENDTAFVDIGGSTVPANIYRVEVYLTEPLTSLKYNFGFVENADGYNDNNLATNSKQGFYGIDIGKETNGVRATNFVSLTPLGEKRDWQTGSAFARFVSVNANGNEQTFLVTHDFVINPLWIEGQEPNLEEDVPPDYLIGDNSLKYVSRAEFREAINDPNRSYFRTDDKTLGSVGWFNESFNGYNNQYKVKSIDYATPQGANSDGLLISGVTRVTVVIEAEAGSELQNGFPIGVAVWATPTEEDYTNKVPTMLKNLFYGFGRGVVGSTTAVANSYVKSVTANTASQETTIEFEVDFGADANALLQLVNSGSNRFIVGALVANDNLNNKNSNRVMLLADYGTFDFSPDIEGLADLASYKLFPHNVDITEDGFTDMLAWNEDGITSTFNLRLDEAKGARLESLSVVLVAYNPTSKEFFRLDEEQIDLAQFARDTSGRVLMELDSDRGYILAQGSQFNSLKISTIGETGTLFNKKFEYSFEVGQKISWQSWIELLDAPNVFVDTAKPFNGLNLRASNYSEKEGYEIRFGLFAQIFGNDLLGNSGITDYLLIGQNIVVKDYSLGDEDPPIFSGVIRTERLNGEVLGTRVLQGEDTKFIAEWTRSDGAVQDANNYWGILRIEKQNQPAYEITELSSIRPLAANSLLKPLQGETQLKLSLSAGKLIMEGLIDGDLVEDGGYNLSARVHSLEGAGIFKTTSPANVDKDTSGTVEKKTPSAP